MVQITLPALLASLAAVAAAKNCMNLTVPISIAARNARFTLQAPASNIEVTDFTLNLAQPGVNYTAKVLSNGTEGPFADVSGHYTIGATYCTPSSGPGKTLQILTHGIAFDRWYWDFPSSNFPLSYSYVDAALARGYSVFFYDRLGLGESSHGEPVNEIQAPLEVQALRALTTKLRSGRVAGIDDTYDKVVHVGHSFGSIQTYALAAAYPGLSDGVALTGFSQAIGSFVAYFLFAAGFVEASGTGAPALAAYPPGYLASPDVSAVQTNFFAPGNFDPAVLEAAYAAGQPVTVGELMTIGTVAAGNNSFTGPVQVITGERDIPFCGGNCLVSEPSLPAQTRPYFPNASFFEAIVVSGAGHGLNLGLSAPSTYASILDFFDKNIQN
ncbi:uracil permease [Hypoxylon texense]